MYDGYLESKKLIIPDITFYIDTPVGESYLRKNRTPGDGIWADKRFLELNQVYYRNQESLYIVDGSKDLSEIHCEVEDVIREGTARK